MTRSRRLLVLVLAAAAAFLPTAASSEGAAASDPGSDARIDTAEPWMWPVDGDVRITAPYAAPSHAYGPGHRGIDLAAPVGSPVRAPASGTVAFVGTVVDRPLVTIDHGGGLVSTLEPVLSDLSPGDNVARGHPVGQVATGGHASAGSLHLGVRLDGEYVNPLLLLGGVPRAVLLPCCGST